MQTVDMLTKWLLVVKLTLKSKIANNEVVATLKDGKKETIISEDGKFVSTYNIYSNEFF